MHVNRMHQTLEREVAKTRTRALDWSESNAQRTSAHVLIKRAHRTESEAHRHTHSRNTRACAHIFIIDEDHVEGATKSVYKYAHKLN